MSFGILRNLGNYIPNDLAGKYLKNVRSTLSFFNTLGIMAIAILGWKVSKKVLAPLDTMTKTVKDEGTDKNVKYFR